MSNPPPAPLEPQPHGAQGIVKQTEGGGEPKEAALPEEEARGLSDRVARDQDIDVRADSKGDIAIDCLRAPLARPMCRWAG